MRTYSLPSIILLCVVILGIDVAAFYWLQSIMEPIPSTRFKWWINGAFLFFSVALVSAIMVLKVRLDYIEPRRKQRLISSLYGLTVSSFIPKIIFVIFITILHITGTGFLNEKSLWIVPVLGLFVGLLPFGVIVYAIFRAVYHFKTYHITVHHKALPKAFRGYRIVHISDLHLGSLNYKYKVLDRAIKIINHLKPDMVCFTGDLINNYAWELKGWEACFLNLAPEIKKYAVLGNHDYGDYSTWNSEDEKAANLHAVKQFYSRINFRLLLNEWESIDVGDGQIKLLGVENWGIPPFKQYGDLEKTLEGTTASDFKILLSHDPTHWSEEVVAHSNIALTLAGHTHGMQAGLRIKNKKWSPIQYKYKHWAGLYKEDGQFLYVTRGLGWLGFPGRIGMRPEITLITLKY